jgi:hypothetical protein
MYTFYCYFLFHHIVKIVIFLFYHIKIKAGTDSQRSLMVFCARIQKNVINDRQNLYL